MPLLWRSEVAHALASNYYLSQVLKSNLKRLQNTDCLILYDAVIKEKVQLGIVDQVLNLTQFMTENPTASFLSHMGVFKLDRETSKCRIVYLSNLAEKSSTGKGSISHNQAMLSGPNLNRKMTTAVLKLRFDKYLICFDLKKAFLLLGLSQTDQNKLLFLWYKNVEHGDLSVVAYKSLRLPFGLICSPALLMLALYKILIIDSADDNKKLKFFKKLTYDLIYMDNGCVTTNDLAELHQLREMLEQTFVPYQFNLQQFVTNDAQFKKKLD